MTVKAILAVKGTEVLTIEPTTNLAAAAKVLAERKIGALVVTGPDRRVIGIDCRELIWGLGTFHCLTQQQPAVL